MARLVAQRRPFRRHHVRVEVGRTPDGLAGVVDDEVEPFARGDEVAAERLDGGRVAQVETEDFESVTPIAEVGLLRVARRGVPREARRDDEVRAGAEELQAGLVADLDASAGEQRDTAAQVRELRARGEIEIGARGAELIVEVVDARVGLLADVADAGGGSAFVVRRLAGRRSALGASWSTSCASKRSGGNTLGVVTTGRRRSVRIPVWLSTASPAGRSPLSRLFAVSVSPVDPVPRAWRSPDEAPPILGREPIEQPPVGSDPLQ